MQLTPSPLEAPPADFSKLSPVSLRTIAALKAALPSEEWGAVELWLSTFYRFQLQWLLDWQRFSLCLKSRQIGASHTYAAAAVIWAMLGETTTIISIGEREAMEMLDKVHRHCLALSELGSRWARHTATNTTVKLASGGRIIALPATSGGRSYSGNVILDELAYHLHPEKVWDGAAGTVMHGYRLRALSTPNGVGNFWHQLWTEPSQNEGYLLHSVTIDEARIDGMPVSEEECRKMSRGDPRVFDQLFRCKFLDNEQQYLPADIILACQVDEPFCYNGECYAGLDLGRNSDRTELVIMKKDQFGVRWQQYSESCKRTSSADVERLAKLCFSPPWRCRKLTVDATGMGAFPAEQLQKRYGRTKIDPISFTNQSKEVLATGLYSAFTEQTVRLAKKDRLLFDDLCAIRRIVTAAGNIRYDAPQTSKGHGDRAWALALALHGSGGPDRRRYEV